MSITLSQFLESIPYLHHSLITACIYAHTVQAVVKANSQKYWKWSNFDSLGFWWNWKNVTMSQIKHANPYDAATTWVVSVNTWLDTCFGFLVDLFDFILVMAPIPHRWTHFDDQYTTCYVFPRKKVIFGVALTLFPICDQIPKLEMCMRMGNTGMT